MIDAYNNILFKEKLLDSGIKIYNEERYAFSLKIFDLLNELKLNNFTLAAGFFLHADLTSDNVRKYIFDFGGLQLVKSIELLQRIGKINFPDHEKQAAELRHLFIELANDLSIIFIKLAERLVTLKTLEEQKSGDLVKVSEECLALYSPIAHRLGIRRIYSEMDDIAFKHFYPEEFNKLSRAIEKKRPIFEKKLKDMTADLKNLLLQNGINARIQFRVKRLYSIYLKISSKGLNINEIFDLMALRVIANTIEECYLTLGVIHRNWAPIEGRFRDWVAFPKANGYRSIQTTVITRSGDRFEIQIRTQEMHNEAEYGSAAHWAYKEKTKAVDNSWIIRLKEFLENDEYFKNPYELQELLKSELKTDFIHVLTPKGDIKTLPKGATPIDFAFLVHTDVGYSVTGARINGKFAKLTSELHSGDVLEVKTSKNASPSRDWLNFVKTAKARSKIMLWLKKNEKDELIEDGKRMWEKFKKKFKHKLEGFDLEKSFKNNLNSIGFKSSDDFYSAISTRSLKLSQTLLRRVYPEPFRKNFVKKLVDKERTGSHKHPEIEVDGMKNIVTVLSKCCNPIKGEPIVAYVTKRSSIKIHSARCEKVLRGEFEEDRLKEANWLSGQSTQIVRLKLIGDNYNDMLNSLVEKTGEEGVILRGLARRDIDDSITSILIEIEVKDIFQLKRFISKMQNSKHVDNVLNN